MHESLHSNTAVLTLKEEKICDKTKQYQILFDKQLKGCCAVAKERGIGRFWLFSSKNNQKGWIESDAQLKSEAYCQNILLS